MLTPLIIALGVSLLAVGVVRLRMGWLVAGAALLAAATFLSLLADDGPWETVEVVSVRIRASDAATGRLVTPARVQIVDAGGKSASVSTLGPDGVTLVSAVVKASGKGSLGQWLRSQPPSVNIEGYHLTINAEGYRPWHKPLARLLPQGWPLVAVGGTIEVRLESSSPSGSVGSN